MTKQYDVKVLSWGQLVEDFNTEWKAYCKAQEALVAAVQAVHPGAPISWPRGSYGRTTDTSKPAIPSASFDLSKYDPKLLASLAAMIAASQAGTTAKVVKPAKRK